MKTPAKISGGRVKLRPVVMPDDDEFLQALYFSVRDDLQALIPDESLQRQLLLMQYAGQRTTYEQEYPNASHDIVLLDSAAVGRLIVDRRPDAVHGVDLALLPVYRNQGVGTQVLTMLFEECLNRGVPFTLSVVKTNPAVRLYQRLGCRIDADHGTHLSMRWNGGEAD